MNPSGVNQLQLLTSPLKKKLYFIIIDHVLFSNQLGCNIKTVWKSLIFLLFKNSIEVSERTSNCTWWHVCQNKVNTSEIVHCCGAVPEGPN